MNALQIAITDKGNQTQLTAAADFAITLNPEAERRKVALLDEAGWVDVVSGEETQTKAVAVTAKLRAYVRDLEKSRVDVKAPFLEAGKQIDAAAKAATAEVNEQIARITLLVKDYQVEEFRKAEEIRKEQQRIADEIQRQRDEVAAAERKRAEDALRAEEDARRKAAAAAAEAERLAAAAKGKKAREEAAAAAATAAAAAAEAQKLEDARVAAEFAAAERPVPPPITFVAAEPAKIDGGKAEMVWNFELLDIRALYEFAGTRFVKMEVDKQALLDYFLWPNTDPTKIPGIRAFQEVKVSIRAKR